MTPTEAVALCRVVKAYCPQQAIDEYTADAYGELLADYSLRDAREAATNLGRRQPFISPAEIAAEIRRIREKRIADYGPLDPPPWLDPDKTGDYVRWIESEHRRIADGDTERPAVAGELEARDVSSLGQLGQDVPDA